MSSTATTSAKRFVTSISSTEPFSPSCSDIPSQTDDLRSLTNDPRPRNRDPRR
jgi:hypothetical protein